MRVAFFSTRTYDRRIFEELNGDRHDLTFLEPRLDAATAPLAAGHDAVCLFVHDHADAAVIATLADLGVRAIALRCAGFNNVDLAAAARHGITVVRVPAYSPHGVAEHAVALLMTLNRRIHRAYNRVREGNFALDGLMGFTVHGKTVGIIGTGKIGACFAAIMAGFGCRLLAFDPCPSDAVRALGAEYVDLPTLFRESHIISLHCPLIPSTRRIIDADALAQMRPGIFIINTSRGELIDTPAVIDALKSGRLGALALDVYEEEEGIFFEDKSDSWIPDDRLARLLTFPNVLITGHQAFFTREAVHAIAETTLGNLDDIAAGRTCANTITQPTA